MKCMRVNLVQRGPFSNVSVSPYYYSETVRDILLPQKGTNNSQATHCLEKMVSKSSSLTRTQK